MQASEKYVAGVGAANVDVHGHSKKPIIMRDSNPGRMSISAGGVTRNILENLSRLGEHAVLVTATGSDVLGDKIKLDSAAAGIDVSHVLTVDGAVSSAYISILDADGDMAVALSDMSILGNLTREYLDSKVQLLRGAEAVVCDPSLPLDIMEYLVSDLAKDKPVFVDPVSTSYARTIKGLIGRYHTVKPNRMELAELSGLDTDSFAGIERASEKLLSLGCERVVTTLGADGCYLADRSGLRLHRKLPPETQMANATGAGDAFTSGLLYSFLHRFGNEQSLDFALACGIAAIRGDSTINPDISVDYIKAILAEKL